MNNIFVSPTRFFPIILKKAQLCLELWDKEGKNVQIGDLLQKFLIDGLGSCIFGFDYDTMRGGLDEPLNAYNHIIKYGFFSLRFFFPWINDIPIPVNIKLKKNFETFDKVCWKFVTDSKKRIEERKNNPDDQTDISKSLIDLMIEAGLSEAVVRDNCGLFILAGQDTSLNILGWSISILATHPDVYEKARKEVMENFPDQLTPDILRNLPYLDAFIKESSRLHGPALQVNGRYTWKEQTIVGNVLLPVGIEVSLDIISMCYDPKIWGDPLNVRPERWFPENLTKEQRSAWMPFSIGERICIGMTFSLLEQKVFLALLLKRYKSIKLAPNGSIIQKFGGLMNAPKFDTLIIQFEPQ
jgi:cytochrome P450